jgi:hypothetical protein
MLIIIFIEATLHDPGCLQMAGILTTRSTRRDYGIKPQIF